MSHSDRRIHVKARKSAHGFEELLRECVAPGTPHDACIAHDGELALDPDEEDAGGDPYNHVGSNTGSFKKLNP